MNILVLAAHPDDEVLGMGGTIKKFTKQRHNVKIVLFATGITSRRATNYKNSTQYKVDKKTNKKMKEQVDMLRKEAIDAAKILGVTDIEFLDFPDNEMDLVSNLQISKEIERIIQKFRPEQVFTHSMFDVNVDHIACYRAVLTATRPKKNTIVKKVISFEVPSSSEWNFTSTFTPNTFVDITHEIKNKIKALQAYKTESEKYPHPRSTKALQAIGNRWGTVSGFSVAEAFFLVRSLED